LKEKTEKLFETNKRLIEQTNEFYNAKGQIVKSVTLDYRNSESITITDYFYNEKGQLVKEAFSGLHSYQDSAKTKLWTDTSIIITKHYIYDSFGQIKFEKDYNFQCNLDSCDIVEFFYEGKLLKKKFCTNDCSMKGRNYNYPIYYKYDKNDSLILEQALGPTDTTKIWYTHSYNYSLLPDKFIYEKFYRKDDSLQLDDRTVTKTEYLKDGRKSRIVFLEKTLSYEDFEYHKNGLLKSQVSFRNDRPTWKLAYQYDKRNNIVRLETYDESKDKKNKLKLYYYQTYDYKYY
jgi:hypothetical protein